MVMIHIEYCIKAYIIDCFFGGILRAQKFPDLGITMMTGYMQCSISLVVLVVDEISRAVCFQEKLNKFVATPGTGKVERGPPLLE